MICSLKVGEVGLNLTSANVVVLFGKININIYLIFNKFNNN